MVHGESRLQLARLMSTVGAGVAGAGLGVLLARLLSGLGVALLLFGALMHAWGMFDGMRLEKAADAPRPKWSMVLYWLCWAVLGILALYVVPVAVRR